MGLYGNVARMWFCYFILLRLPHIIIKGNKVVGKKLGNKVVVVVVYSPIHTTKPLLY